MTKEIIPEGKEHVFKLVIIDPSDGQTVVFDDLDKINGLSNARLFLDVMTKYQKAAQNWLPGRSAPTERP